MNQSRSHRNIFCNFVFPLGFLFVLPREAASRRVGELTWQTSQPNVWCEKKKIAVFG